MAHASPPATLGHLTGGWSPGPVAASVTTVSVAVLATGAVVGPWLPARWGVVLLVVAGLLGLPHGAVDHLALGWAAGRTGPARAGVLVAYAAAALAAATGAVLVPLPAVLALLALSAAHFAEGEAAFDRLRGGAGLRLPAAALGVAVVVLPIELHPSVTQALLVELDPGLPAALSSLRPVLLAATAMLVVAGLVTALRGLQRRAAAELALVVLACLVAPPLVAFPLWFAGWHGPRHLVRLAALEPAGDGRERGRRLVTGAAGPTAVAVAGLVVLVVVLGALPGAVLVVLLALTVPHAAVVARLDRVTGSRVGTWVGPAQP